MTDLTYVRRTGGHQWHIATTGGTLTRCSRSIAEPETRDRLAVTDALCDNCSKNVTMASDIEAVIRTERDPVEGAPV